MQTESDWHIYVDNLLDTGHVSKAVIADHDGDIWAKSNNFDITKEEILRVIHGFDDSNSIRGSGAILEGQKYIILTATDRTITAKKGQNGAVCVKTAKTVIISIYDHTMQPGQTASVTEKLGDYLTENGY